MLKFFPPASRPWIVWLTCCLFAIYQFLLQISVSVMTPDFTQAFGINAIDLGILASSYFYSYVLLQLPVGILIDRFGVKRIILAGLFGCMTASAAFATSQTFWQALISRIFMGIFSTPAFIAALYLAANWFPAHRFPLIVGLTETVGIGGAVIGQICLAHALSNTDFHTVLWYCVLANALLIVINSLLIQDHPQQHHPIDLKPQQSSSMLLQALKNLLCNKNVWLLGLFTMCLGTVMEAFAGLWCIPFLQQAYGFNLQQAAHGSTTILLGVAAGAPLWGQCGTNRKKRPSMMLGGTLTCIITLNSIIYLHPPLIFLHALLFMIGLSSSVYMFAFSFIREMVPLHIRGTGLGLMNSFCMLLGTTIFQPWIGFLLEKNARKYIHVIPDLIDYHHALMVLPFALIVGLLLIPSIRAIKTHPIENNPPS